jgi:hypothetical protein
VNLGDQVTTGTPLIEFDMDYVALHAKSLLTQVVVTNSERVAEFVYQTGLVEAGKDIFLELVLEAGDETTKATAGESATSEPIVIPNPAGLHARPAAVLVNLAKKYQSQVFLHRGDDQVNAKSVVAIMAMQVGPWGYRYPGGHRPRCQRSHYRTDRSGPVWSWRRRGSSGLQLRPALPNRR